MFKKLKLAQRLGLLAALFAVPVIFVLWSLVTQLDVEVDFTAKEVVGANYLKALSPILFKLEARQYDSTIDISGMPGALSDAQTNYAKDLDTADAAKAAVTAATASAATPDKQDLLVAAQAAVLALEARIGDRSNLILDNVLDSYYMADVALNRLPTLLDKIPDMEQDAGIPADHDDFLLSAGAVSDNRDGLDASLSSALADNLDGTLKQALASPYQGLKSQLDDVVNQAKASRKIDVSRVMNTLEAFNEDVDTQLEALVSAREGHLLASKWRTLGIAFPLFAGALALLAYTAITQITRPVTRLTAAMKQIAGGKLDVTILGSDRFDEIGEMARATEVFLEHARENDRLETEKKAGDAVRLRRQEALEALSADFNHSVTGQLHTLSAASTELEATAHGLLDRSGATQTRTQEVQTSVASSTETAEAVAAATKELAASSDEIGSQIERTALITRDAVARAEQAGALVTELSQAVSDVTNVVGFINDIASQTNLLALNATIEAARAGGAGKGFAVVASEVKALANQTSQATGEIDAKIQTVQATASNVARIIGQIADVIRDRP
jgi:methyl-accepting chemotaxis protein